MHEMSLCESLVQVIEEQAKAQGFVKVKTVFLEIGAFAGIETDSMRFCFDVVCRNTMAHAAKLEIIELPGTAWCFECEQTVTVSDRLDPCPSCGSFSLRTKGGDEMRIKELEVL